MHPIKLYCLRHGITQRAFARRADLSDAFVSQVINGAEKCGREAAERIVAASDGEITFEDLFGWSPGPQAAA